MIYVYNNGYSVSIYNMINVVTMILAYNANIPKRPNEQKYLKLLTTDLVIGIEF